MSDCPRTSDGVHRRSPDGECYYCGDKPTEQSAEKK